MTARSVQALGDACQVQGRYSEAESLYRDALAMTEHLRCPVSRIETLCATIWVSLGQLRLKHLGAPQAALQASRMTLLSGSCVDGTTQMSASAKSFARSSCHPKKAIRSSSPSRATCSRRAASCSPLPASRKIARSVRCNASTSVSKPFQESKRPSAQILSGAFRSRGARAIGSAKSSEKFEINLTRYADQPSARQASTMPGVLANRWLHRL